MGPGTGPGGDGARRSRSVQPDQLRTSELGIAKPSMDGLDWKHAPRAHMFQQLRMPGLPWLPSSLSGP